MNRTSINARNWGERRHFVSLYVVQWVYVGLGVAQTSREKGCSWRGFSEMTAEESNGWPR